LLFPQGFLKSITYAIIASVMLAAILSITVLAAALAILGPRVDSVGVKMLVRFAQPDPITSDPANPRSNPLALASIPVGILLPPLGIAFGHIARSRIRTTGERGAGLALIGLVVGYVSLMCALGYGVVALRDAGIVESALYWILLGVVIFVSVVIAGLALARAVPLLRGPIVWWLNWLAEKTQKTKTRAEVEKGFWGKLVNVVMRRPGAFALPIVIVMIILIIPLGQLALGGISEKYLPPDNAVRVAQEEFDKTFPGFRTEPLTLVIESDNGQPVSNQQIAEVRNDAMQIPGFIEQNNDPSTMWKERPYLDGASKDPNVRVLQNGLVTRGDASKKINELRAMAPPRGVTVSVGGTPALEQDSIHSLFTKLPLMVVVLILTTTVLMFLAFGSLVLPIKAALMSALTLGSTMGILTWMFVDGHGSGLMNYTPQPLMAPMIGLIIAGIWGLSTDYEVFLVSRMVEARARGMSTAEAIRIGTATTGRLITGAALVLAVVAGAFVFSDLVMMKYLAFGLLLALLLDATIVRMFLVPAIMKMLGDDCWWAPRWMKRIQERIGLGELELPDERKRPSFREPEEALLGAGAPVRPRPPHDPGHPDAGTPRPGGPGRPPPPPRALPPSTAGTTRIPIAPGAPAGEPPTTRFKAPTDAAPGANAVPDAPTTRTPRANPNRSATPTTPPSTRASRRVESQRGSTQNREIESWLGELRSGNGAPAGGSSQPSAEPTRSMPEQRPTPRQARPQAQPVDEPTTAIPTQRPQEPGTTEKIATREAGDDEPKRRGGGGVSASDLLRREGRL
ncbi:MAG: trehalose monomycolate/heme transporter, partial [Mycobacterium sp.]|nr:trehalose monomycolate/heme transporter [Mycobacterium sp.]